MKYIYILIASIYSLSLTAQIRIDEQFDDWSNIALVSDAIGDASSTSEDFVNVQVSNDDKFLYFKFELTNEILLQENNRIELLIDIDNDASTGSSAEGLGYEILFDFGDKKGTLRDGNFDFAISHKNIGLVTLPSLSSKTFELCIERNLTGPTGSDISIDGSISYLLRDNRSNGDIIPEEAADRTYTIQDNQAVNAPEVTLQEQGDFRFVVYNSLFDGFFDYPQAPAQRDIIKSLEADIYAFVEIYDNSSAQIAQVIEGMFPGETWYHADQGADTHIISKYPVKDQDNIDGNGGYLLDLGTSELLVIVAHLPAGDNNTSRQREVDNIIAFIRDAKDGANFQLQQDTPILITGDMNLYGDSDQRKTLLTGDIKFNNSFGDDEAPDWDGSDLTAALPYATGSNQAITWSSDNSGFNPGRLDYVIYSDAVIRLDNTFALDTETMTDAQLIQLGLNRNDTRIASDHFPIIADFSLVPTSVQDIEWESIGIQLRPNPVVDHMTIQAEQDGHITIYNITGQIQSRQSILQNQSLSIDTHDWNNGIYIVEYQTLDAKSSRKKIVIDRR